MSACAALSEALWRLPEKRTASTRPSSVGEGEVDATEGAVEFLGSHADFARAHDLAGPRAEAVDLEGGASHRLAIAGERAGAAQPAENWIEPRVACMFRYSAERR